MNRKVYLTIAASFMTAVILAGCGKSESAADYSAKSAADNSNYAAAEAAYDYEEAAYAEGDSGSGAVRDESSKENSTGNIELTSDKIVYTANLSISTKEFDKSVEASKALAKKYDAVVQSESFYDSDTSWYTNGNDYRTGNSRHYEVSLRIPSKNYDSFLNATGEIEGVIDSKSSNAENISQEYYDTKEVIASYEDELKRLKELMENAIEMEDISTLEEKITSVQTTLNQERSHLRRMDTDVAYSYVNLDIREVAVYEKQQIVEKSYGERLAAAFVESVTEFGIFIGNLLLLIVRHWAVLLFLALIVFGIVMIVRSAEKKSREKQKARMEAMRAGNVPNYRPIAAPQNNTAQPNGVNNTGNSSEKTDSTQKGENQ